MLKKIRGIWLIGIMLTAVAAYWNRGGSGQVTASPARSHQVSYESQAFDAGRWLSGRVILVDPGHGGDDPGTVVGQTLEKDVVLPIGLQVKRLLEEQGATVYLTREKDEDLGGTVHTELGRRVALVDDYQANVYVSIHANADSCDCRGAQTFYQHQGMGAGRELALAIQAQLRRLTPTTREAQPADFFVLRTSPVPAALVEVGFLSDAKEHKQLLDPSYQQRLASAIVLGLSDFFRTQA